MVMVIISGKSKRGELSIFPKTFQVLSYCLHMMPKQIVASGSGKAEAASGSGKEKSVPVSGNAEAAPASDNAEAASGSDNVKVASASNYKVSSTVVAKLLLRYIFSLDNHI